MKRIRLTIAFKLLVQAALWAQGATSLRGIVTDPQKGVIGNAAVKLTDADNGLI